MPEDINGIKVFSLLEVTKSIQKTISARYGSSYWIKAEMNKLNYYRQSGHCYPELVEKINGKIVAQISGNIWNDDYEAINEKFLKVLKEPLKEGIKILFSARIGFHPQYGLSLRILDIDPAYTLGDLEKEKNETIQRLKDEGIYSRNKELEIPVLPKRIAIISVESSKGYADFIDVLASAHKSWNYTFFHLLFPSLLQGDSAIQAIIHQLRRVKSVIHHFDVVAIIRGGGGDVGLSCFNNYRLVREIALFPIPVLTGIGHSTNETVVEMISFENAITPTKLAEFLIQKFHNFSVPVQKARETIIDKSRRLLKEEKTGFSSAVKLFRSVTQRIIAHNKHEVKQNVQALLYQSRNRIKAEKDNLKYAREEIKKGTYQLCAVEKQNITQLSLTLKKDIASHFRQLKIILKSSAQNVNNLSPKSVLKRGYSITQYNGSSIYKSDQVKEGELIKTILYEGTLTSTVKHISKTNSND